MQRRQSALRWHSGMPMRLGLAAALLVGLLAHAAAAASLSAGDLLVLGRVLAFVQPPPAGSIVIAYASGDAASRADAEAIAGLIGDGIRFGGGVLRPKLVAVDAVTAAGASVVIAAAGANGQTLGAAIRAAHALCVTAELAVVQAGLCTVAIQREPRVEIVVSHAAAAAAGLQFATAFRMMSREL